MTPPEPLDLTGIVGRVERAVAAAGHEPWLVGYGGRPRVARWQARTIADPAGTWRRRMTAHVAPTVHTAPKVAIRPVTRSTQEHS